MEPEPNLEDLKKIRSLMERSSMYRSLSGLSGVAAGVIGLIVYAIVYGIVDPMVEKRPEMKSTDEGQLYLIKIFFTASVICLILVFAAIFYFNRRKAKRHELPFFEPAMQKMFLNLFIPLIAGGVYCLMLIHEKQFLLIAPSMLIFYGLGMINASRHTIIEIRYLGLVELILGLIAIFMKEYGMWFWLAGFGIVNLIYGAYIYLRYEKSSHDSQFT
ncbi:MAG TPA: hypothetical protein VE978_14375 [Chitinophagales bacterium]|nr:hypothetical protein [Chitinophagales bacterium]